MRLDRSESDRLKDIMRYAQMAYEMGGVVTQAAFLANPTLRFATCYALQIVGEAAYHIGAETRGRLPAIPWRQIVVFRHRLVHDYFEIDYRIVWRVASGHASDLVAQLGLIVGSAGSESNLEKP